MLFEKLAERHLVKTASFSCIETEGRVSALNAKQRRRVLKHSREMEDFLRNEAFSEQELGTNTTHLLIDEQNGVIVAYISLCADAIPLELKEREEEGMTYSTSPALKIARLAVATDYHGRGIGKQLIRYAAYVAHEMTENCGIAFLTLDCYEHRVSFYEHLGFKRNQIQITQRKYDSPISMRANLNALANRLFDLQ
ncbi:MAG: GNAT family N-acetyltransferase [Fretibacterium sp.]|nr:GNAT family N-acetyltransferase [Fretibacterium sp.]